MRMSLKLLEAEKLSVENNCYSAENNWKKRCRVSENTSLYNVSIPDEFAQDGDTSDISEDGDLDSSEIDDDSDADDFSAFYATYDRCLANLPHQSLSVAEAAMVAGDHLGQP